MAESRNTIDRSDLDAIIYKTFKIIKEDRKLYPDKYGRRVPGLPLPLTVLIFKDNVKLQNIFKDEKFDNMEFTKYIYEEVSAYEKNLKFNDQNKALQVYNAMGFTYPPSIGQREPIQYFKTLKENDLKNSGNATKENIDKRIGSTSYKEAYY